MKISANRIQQIMEDGKQKGIEIRIRDLSYYALCKTFDDTSIAYKVTFDRNADNNAVESYENGKEQKFIRKWFGDKNGSKEVSDSLTFSENKAALIEMLNEITELADSGEIAQKDAMKMKADIRVRLQDKFQVQDEDRGTIVVVPAKFNHICSRFSCECYIYDKEFAKKEFHLIDDPKYKGKDNAK